MPINRKNANPVFLTIPMSFLLLLNSSCKGNELKNKSPHDYFKDAVTVIQSKALKSSQVDWSTVLPKAKSLVSSARTTQDTYPAISYILGELKDQHSMLITKQGLSVTANRNFTQVEKCPRVSASGFRELNGKRVGFLNITGFGASNQDNSAQTFAQDVQKEIANVGKVSGWIIDLRSNSGGNMWPMLVGIGPILGSGTLGYFKYPNCSVAWFYEQGRAGVINKAVGKHANFEMKDCLPDFPSAPVAVLVSKETASSGEAVAISFKGRPKTVLLGTHTRGLSTNNEIIKLSDGAKLALTTSGETDRNGILYDSGIEPDIVVAQGTAAYGSEDDPAIKRALIWIIENQ